MGKAEKQHNHNVEWSGKGFSFNYPRIGQMFPPTGICCIPQSFKPLEFVVLCFFHWHFHFHSHSRYICESQIFCGCSSISMKFCTKIVQTPLPALSLPFQLFPYVLDHPQAHFHFLKFVGIFSLLGVP